MGYNVGTVINYGMYPAKRRSELGRLRCEHGAKPVDSHWEDRWVGFTVTFARDRSLDVLDVLMVTLWDPIPAHVQRSAIHGPSFNGWLGGESWEGFHGLKGLLRSEFMHEVEHASRLKARMTI